MINRAALTHWSGYVPWKDNAQIEQDLIICRALIAIYSNEFLASQLAFRGGTALHKIYLSPQPRYSEDIDLVQINPGPIKEIMYRLGEVLDFLPDRVTKQKRYNNTMVCRIQSEIPPIVQLRLKVEINCFEHFNVLGLVKKPFEMNNSWFNGKADITTYQCSELLGTKLRALYQRKKGRDLFDLYVGLVYGGCNADEIVQCYKRYMSFVVEKPPTYKQFINNIELKIQDAEFLGDTKHLIRPELKYNPQEAYIVVKEQLINRLL
ncbi:MAG: nucleotidyl transferase AbiEii/AbiGii toxin family protein [Prevotella sp.]|nr:nucleotidyl transferase AbiEii/AbiGii toxin family protein [Prevotella sp.]